MDVEDLDVYKKLNGFEKTLERKVLERERRWQLAEESAVYGVNDELLLQGWPITAGQASGFLTPDT